MNEKTAWNLRMLSPPPRGADANLKRVLVYVGAAASRDCSVNLTDEYINDISNSLDLDKQKTVEVLDDAVNDGWLAPLVLSSGTLSSRLQIPVG